MATVWIVVIGLVLVSWVSARDRGVPWFSLGKSRRKPEPVRLALKDSKPALKGNLKAASPKRPPKRRFALKELELAKPQRTKERFPTAAHQRLDELTHNVDTSKRLIAHMRQLHPDRSLKWCAEKAIYDIERDRMAR